MKKMNWVLRAGIAALGLVSLFLVTVESRAQDEGDDIITKLNGQKQQGKVKAEDLKGCTVSMGKGVETTLAWKDIKSIEYSGSPEFKRGMQYVNGGSYADAIAVLDPLTKKELRDILKPHALNFLAFSLMNQGEYDAAIAKYTELFKAYPKTQFLIKGGGENLITCHLAKRNNQGAKDALDALIAGLKSVGGDINPLNLLRGRVQEATGDFSSAAASYKQVLDSATDDATKGAAELGIARCLLGQKKTGEAEAKFRGLVSRELPWLVLAGAWNGIGDILLESARAKPDQDTITNALYAYLRGCVLYTPMSGEPTNEYEHAVRGAYDAFTGLSQIEKDAKRKDHLARQARERLEHLQAKFPGSPYIPGK
jgi:tetratricopeptide (TPR) repeat protein